MYSTLNFFCCLPYLNVPTELFLIYIYRATENNGAALPLNKRNNSKDKNIDDKWIRDCGNPFIVSEYAPDESHHLLPRKTPQWENNRQGDHTQILLLADISLHSPLSGMGMKQLWILDDLEICSLKIFSNK